MTPELANQILFKMNHQPTFEALEDYCEERIKTLQNILETESNINIIKETQGQIKELRNLLKIRQLANDVKNVEKINGTGRTYTPNF